MSLSVAMKAHGLTDSSLADALGVSPEAVRLWRTGQRKLSAERVLEIEGAARIPRHEIRPEIFPPPTAEAAL